VARYHVTSRPVSAVSHSAAPALRPCQQPGARHVPNRPRSAKHSRPGVPPSQGATAAPVSGIPDLTSAPAVRRGFGHALSSAGAEAREPYSRPGPARVPTACPVGARRPKRVACLPRPPPTGKRALTAGGRCKGNRPTLWERGQPARPRGGDPGRPCWSTVSRCLQPPRRHPAWATSRGPRRVRPGLPPPAAAGKSACAGHERKVLTAAFRTGRPVCLDLVRRTDGRRCLTRRPPGASPSVYSGPTPGPVPPGAFSRPAGMLSNRRRANFVARGVLAPDPNLRAVRPGRRPPRAAEATSGIATCLRRPT